MGPYSVIVSVMAKLAAAEGRCCVWHSYQCQKIFGAPPIFPSSSVLFIVATASNVAVRLTQNGGISRFQTSRTRRE